MLILCCSACCRKACVQAPCTWRWQLGTKRNILVYFRFQQMPLFRQLWFLLSLALGLIGNVSGGARAGNLEAVLELQISKFSAFINVKGDCRQNMLETFLFILQGWSLNALLLPSGRVLPCYQPCSCPGVIAADPLPVLRDQLPSVG